MKGLLALLARPPTTFAKLLKHGGANATVADSLLMKQQLLIINRSRPGDVHPISWPSSIPGKLALPALLLTI